MNWIFSPDPAVEEAAARIQRLHPQQYAGGLARTAALLEKLGNPHHRLAPVFHVAGTNGKGSTLAFMQAICEAAGMVAHKYTSPHLVRFEERFVLGGRQVDGAALVALTEEVEKAAQGLDCSFFEFFTALMFLAASRKKADVVLLETGLGGTFDATNAVKDSVAILTRISRDHTHILGDTEAQIAVSKAGILRKGRPAVIAPQPAPGVMDVFEARALELHAPLFRAGREWQVRPEGDGFVFESAKQSLRLPPPALQGAHQVTNAATAVAALEAGGHVFKQDALEAAMRNVAWPGRLQRLAAGPLALPEFEVWLDGAHNDSGAEMLAREMAGPVHLVTAMKKDKNSADFYRILAPKIASVQVLAADIGAPMQDAAALAAELMALGLPDVHIAENLESAATRIASSHGGQRRILVAGSLYLAGYVLRTHS